MRCSERGAETKLRGRGGGKKARERESGREREGYHRPQWDEKRPYVAEVWKDLP